MAVVKIWVSSQANAQEQFLTEYQVDSRSEVALVPTTDALGSEILVLSDVSIWRLAWDAESQVKYWKELR
ncbi:MAG: hypothetical protein MJ157_04480 [Clostridia bacterium]|nr:hypothetical protein [Clostridia bacterium]